VQIWDTVKMKKYRTMQGHSSRIGAIAWNSNIFSSGSRDKTILHRDLRVSQPFISKLTGHRQ
jgi:cell division cycle 20-like protein 1 (cofactor of APC complex)